MHIEVLYRDDDVLVVNKPSGLLTHRSAMASETDVAMTRSRDTVGAYVWPVHRLDRGTSGALAFALSEESARELRAAFDQHRVRKRYVALARGVLDEAIRVDYPVPKGEGQERVPAITSFRRIYAGEHFSWVEAIPETGRYHQIRRHLSHLRHPIAGDTNYGTGWFNRYIRDYGLRRLALHAASLTLPTRDGDVEIEAPVPTDMKEALVALGMPSSHLTSGTADR